MRILCLLPLVAVFCGLAAADEPKEEKAKVIDAKRQLRDLDNAVAQYRGKNDSLPDSLMSLVDAKLIDAKGVIDPWGKEYQYDVTGKRNDGKKPDIWTVSPAKETIGNWPAEKK